MIFEDGGKGVHTQISHGKNEYSDHLLSKVAKQLKVNKQELIDLIKCPISKEEYLNILEDDDDDSLEILAHG